MKAQKISDLRRGKVEKAIQDLVVFRNLGMDLNGRLGDQVVVSQGQYAEITQEKGINPDNIRRSRLFASLYPKSEFDELCESIREHQLSHADKDPVFGKTHIYRVLSIPKDDDRKEIQFAAIVNCWSLKTLEKEIANRFGPRKHGGRQRRIPNTLTEFLVQTEALCESWRRWKQELSKNSKEVETEHIVLTKVPKGLRVLIKEASEKVFSLHLAVEARLGKKKGRERRKAILPENHVKDK